MEVLIHFIIELVKISILGSVYAVLTLGAFKIIGYYKPLSWFNRASKSKLSLWFLSGVIISISLTFFMFTHYGDHGLGDSARVPLGHHHEIQEVNGTQAYIQDKGINALDVNKFIITDDYVYGLINANENYEGKYFIYDLANNIVKTFGKEKDYIDFLKIKNLDTSPIYKDFSYYYNEYWNGWRLWLLP